MEDDEKTFLAMCIIGIIVVIAVFSYIVPFASPIVETYEGEIWTTNAPFGKYWIESSSTGNFLAFSSHSNFEESYTIKFLDGDELKTIILESTDVDTHIYFTNNTNEMTYKFTASKPTNIYGHIFGSHSQFPLEESRHWTCSYEIWIPEPNLLKGE